MQIFQDTEAAWESMYADCAAAREKIYLEQFILDTQAIGEKFSALFIQKAREGVAVHLVIDAVGSYEFTLSLRFVELQEAGVKVHLFGVVPRWRSRLFFSSFGRNHRKLLVTDDMAAHIGGIVVSEPMRRSKDLHARFTDDIGIFSDSFEAMVKRVQEEPVRSGEILFDDKIRLIENDPERRLIYETLLDRIEKAQSRIFVVTPYFSPDERMYRALTSAVLRNVDVQVFLPRKTDTRIADTVTKSYVEDLLDRRVRIFLGADENHAKCTVVDEWMTFGSCNFDRLSFFYNYELNVESGYPRYVREIAEVIDGLRQRSRELTGARWRARPWKAKMWGNVGYLMRPFA